MRVALHLTIDIDPEAWEGEYGIAGPELREDVKEYVTNSLREYMHDRGVLGPGHVTRKN